MPASYDYSLVMMSLVALAIFRGHYQQTPSELQMLSVRVQPLIHSVAVQRLPQSSIGSSHSCYLCHRRCRLCPPILAVSVHQARSAATNISPCAAVPFWRLWPPPSQVHYLRSACPALYLHHPHLPNSLHCQNLQDRKDFLL